jgi:hypothetical protein
MKKLIAVMLLLGCGSAWAIPVTWTLENVFSGDRAFTGSLDYDADTNAYSNIDIFYDYDDPEGDGYHYFYETTVAQHNGEYFESDSTQALLYPAYDFPEHYDFLLLVFNSPLTNSGGDISLSSASGIYNQYIYDGGTITGVSAITSGSITANVVPIPAAVWLFGSALAGLGWMRRRKTV